MCVQQNRESVAQNLEVNIKKCGKFIAQRRGPNSNTGKRSLHTIFTRNKSLDVSEMP
jgi:hypothetical protein